MKLLLVLCLVLAECGCAWRGGTGFATILNSSTLAMRRGELDHAYASAEDGFKRAQDASEAEWAERFALLRIEILLRQHDLAAARQRLAEFPSGRSDDSVSGKP